MTGQYATLFIIFFIYKIKTIVFFNIMVKSLFYEYKIQIYHAIFLDLYLSGTNKQPGVAYATHILEGESDGVSCLAWQQNWGQKHSINGLEWEI